MNWEAIGALAELAGALGVILSLVYLAYQIRLNSKQIKQNSDFIESSIYQSVNDATLAWQAQIAQSPEVAMIWRKIRGGIELEESEQSQAWGLVSMLFVTIDTQHKHFTSGVVSRAPLTQEGIDQLFESPYIKHWLDRSAASILTPEFLTEINRIRDGGT